MNFKQIIGFAAITVAVSCQSGPQDIKLGTDQCDHCKMTITEQKFAAELVTEKGRVYKFDDVQCMKEYAKDNADKSQNAKTYGVDFTSGKFVDLSSSTLIQGGKIESPMGGNYRVYSDKAAAQKAAAELGAKLVN